jgi:hypothetical protein
LLLSLSWKYFLLVLIAVMGVLQGAAARNNLRGLQFFGHRSVSYVFAAMAAGFSLFFFFHWNYRYATGVIEGAQQVGLFALGTLAALVGTVGVSSAIRSAHDKRQVIRLLRPETHHVAGPRRVEAHHVVRTRGLAALNRAIPAHILRNRVNGRH